jgi:hypothetical protein
MMLESEAETDCQYFVPNRSQPYTLKPAMSSQQEEVNSDCLQQESNEVVLDVLLDLLVLLKIMAVWPGRTRVHHVQ